ncbi:SRPBCC family protein [Acidovorax sp. LjRoot118]|uniref:SRPBCC family protein n=1 Tax=Acidovorax sp. LjRoot118 TaxID=3342256 RepID=UPI003ECF706A
MPDSHTPLSPPSSPPSTDRLERSIFIAAPRSRVWQALTTAETFGQWFGVALQGQRFAPGRYVRGNITIAGYEHVMFDALVDSVEPETRFAYRWHPYAVDAQHDYSAEPRTLVSFTLQDEGAGTRLTVVESGFDGVPPERRLAALHANTGGWEEQLLNIQRHVAPGA